MIRLKEARLKAGLLQAQVADRIGVDKRTVSAYEVGRRKPTQEVLAQLADALGVSVDWLKEVSSPGRRKRQATVALKSPRRRAQPAQVAPATEAETSGPAAPGRLSATLQELRGQALALAHQLEELAGEVARYEAIAEAVRKL